MWHNIWQWLIRITGFYTGDVGRESEGMVFSRGVRAYLMLLSIWFVLEVINQNALISSKDDEHNWALKVGTFEFNEIVKEKKNAMFVVNGTVPKK